MEENWLVGSSLGKDLRITVNYTERHLRMPPFWERQACINKGTVSKWCRLLGKAWQCGALSPGGTWTTWEGAEGEQWERSKPRKGVYMDCEWVFLFSLTLNKSWLASSGEKTHRIKCFLCPQLREEEAVWNTAWPALHKKRLQSQSVLQVKGSIRGENPSNPLE